MPLQLVTGPANAAKAGAVLGALRRRADDDPVLVVPAYEDVEHNQRELARSGIVFGVRVVRFKELFRLIAERTGRSLRPATDLQRRLILDRAIGQAGLVELRESAQGPGFVQTGLRFTAELEGAGVDPARLTQALGAWAADGGREGYAREVSAIYRRYRDGMDAARLVDEPLLAAAALAALRARPDAWGRSPVYVYGFDDFTQLELEALEALGRRVDVDVVASLPYEAGREALGATARVREDLAELAADVVVLEPVSDHYAPQSREALHALERGLFDPQARPVASGGAVRLHRAGGERAELELCGAEVLALLRDGVPAGEIAVVFRDPGRYASLVGQVFGAYGIPYSIDHSMPLRHTGLGAGLLALLRCACLDGTAADLLAYLRTPGLLRQRGLADRLEVDVRRQGVTDAHAARALWEERPGRWPLEEIDALAEAAEVGSLALLRSLDRRLERLFSAPYRRAATVLAGPEIDDPRAFDAAHGALAELYELVEADRTLVLTPAAIHDLLADLPVRTGEPPQPDRVQVASPLAVRARRFEAVFVCGLQEGEFPAGAASDAFLPDSDRYEVARASGLVLRPREDQLGRERYLFYVCASRATRLLVLSSRYCDEDGDHEAESFFVDDVRVLFTDLDQHERRRTLADVTWTPETAPTSTEWQRAVARRGPRRRRPGVSAVELEAAAAVLAERRAVSASAIEKYADCPVKWLVEDVLDPERLEPDPEQMVRGSYAHRVLELTYRRLREQTGERSVRPENLAEAERIMIAALDELRGEFRISPDQTRVRAAVRRLEFDLLRYLRHESRRDGLFIPEHLELRFGFEEEEGGHPAVELADGTLVRGKVDRVDVWGDRALVRDYKGGRVDKYKASDWERERRLQVALYMDAVGQALGIEVAGGVYVPLGGVERRPRGVVDGDLAEELGSDFFDRDRLAADEVAAHVERARAQAAEIAAGMRSGSLASCPDTCQYRGGCAYPSICGAER